MVQTRLCLTCQGPFEVSPGSSKRYCSPGCWPAPNDHPRIKKEAVEVPCAQCGKPTERAPYEFKRAEKLGWAFYCSTDCRDAAKRGRRGKRRVQRVTLECVKCGGKFEVMPGDVAKRRFCSRECARWEGGRPPVTERKVDRNGYVSVYVPLAERPPGQERYSRFQEHRLVMWKHLGRWLEPHETVHHVNGRKTDNRIENLQLRTPSNHGPGQVRRCRACGSHDIEFLEL